MENQHKQIKGYRDLSQEEIDLMNKIKALAEQVGELVKELEDTMVDAYRKRPTDYMTDTEEDVFYDECNNAEHWVASGKKDLQLGFMQLTRAVAKPTTF